jgi:hypothetical protein
MTMAQRSTSTESCPTQSHLREALNGSGVSHKRSKPTEDRYSTRQSVLCEPLQLPAETDPRRSARHDSLQHRRASDCPQRGGELSEASRVPDSRHARVPHFKLSQKGEDFVKNRKKLRPNELPVTIIFDHGYRVEERVLLDSGSQDNWISWEFCQEHRLRYEDTDEETVLFQDASRQLVCALGRLEAEWPFRARRRWVSFRVAKMLPTRVLFGHTLMLLCKMMRNNFDEPLAPIVRVKMTDGAY